MTLDLCPQCGNWFCVHREPAPPAKTVKRVVAEPTPEDLL